MALKETQYRRGVKDWCLPLPKQNYQLVPHRKTHDGNANCGGVIRNEEGRWMLRFLKHIGCCSILEAEGVYEGLHRAWNRGARKVILETDSLEVRNLFQQDNDRNRTTTLHHHIESLLKRDCEVKFEHIYREGSRIADCTARLAGDGDGGIKLFVTSLEAVLDLLQEEGGI
ncbi:uncharacterized protein LOC120191613 [Hibiscus syriacus]|uniref:uncharacterized protein LOC120191613 n=1 Tax=Hibiscus syriacus TaxID=106335 RepID=UPI00192381AB|nr:uncharacterized protein LOC120191613 [Hibiscus syriacus]